MLRKVILSKGRSDTITTHKFLNEFTLVCPESEVEKYKAAVPGVDIVPIPDDVTGLGRIRNWVMDRFYSVCNIKAMKITNPDVVEDIIANMYCNAVESGANVFGLNQTPDPRKYMPNSPFKLNGWLGTVIGVIGKDQRFDEKNKLRVDVDFCLTALMNNRIIWVENRFSFGCIRNTNSGGNALFRSEERLKREKKYLEHKWGKYILFGEGKGTDTVRVSVERTDPNIKF